MTKCQRIFCIRDTAEDGHGTISIAKATQRKKLAKNVTPSLPVRQTRPYAALFCWSFQWLFAVMSIRPIIGKLSSLLPLEWVPTNGRTTKIVTSFARRTEGQTELLPAAFTSLSGERLKQNIRIFFILRSCDANCWGALISFPLRGWLRSAQSYLCFLPKMLKNESKKKEI